MTNKIKKDGNLKSRIYNKMSTFSSGLLAVAALLTIAGIFIGFGNLIQNNIKDHNSQAWIWSSIFKTIGDIFFNLIPLLFVMAIVATFTKKAMAVFIATISWIALLSFSSTMIVTRGEGSNLSYWVFNTVEIKGGSSVQTILGFKTLDPGVLWAFIIAAIVIFVYDKTSNLKLPKYLSFWEGERLVPFIMLLIIIPVSIVYVFIWPIVGNGFVTLGQKTATVPGGMDTFLMDYVTSLLLPFGLHHFWYSTFLFGKAGGELTGYESFNAAYTDIHGHVWAAGTPIYQIFNQITPGSAESKLFLEGSAKFSGTFAGAQAISGDQNLLVRLQGNTQVNWTWLHEHLQTPKNMTTYKAALNNNQHIGVPTDYTLGYSDIAIRAGKYISGYGSAVFFGYPAAAAAMILLARKENRKATAALMGGALTAVFLGISEPFVYTFLFVSPYLYFLLFSPLKAVSMVLSYQWDMHFNSQDILNIITTGIIPQIAGQKNHWYMMFVNGLIVVVPYFVIFYYSIKWGGLQTPGRSKDGNISFVSKRKALSRYGVEMSDKKADKNLSDLDKKVLSTKKQKNKSKENVVSDQILKYLGGKSNIKKLNNCASRLRVDIIDKLKVDENGLKKTGAFGTVWVGDNHIQIIYGALAQRYRLLLEDKIK